MPRLSAASAGPTIGVTGKIVDKIETAIGEIPNTFNALEEHCPTAVGAMLADGSLATGALNRHDQATINLVISHVAGCDYCVAAHSMLGRLAGLTPAELLQIRKDEPTGNAKRDALVRFMHRLARTGGFINDDDFGTIKAAGYSDEQLVDISLSFETIAIVKCINPPQQSGGRVRCHCL